MCMRGRGLRSNWCVCQCVWVGARERAGKRVRQRASVIVVQKTYNTHENKFVTDLKNHQKKDFRHGTTGAHRVPPPNAHSGFELRSE